MHQGEKVKCPNCGSCFSKKSNLHNHLNRGKGCPRTYSSPASSPVTAAAVTTATAVVVTAVQQQRQEPSSHVKQQRSGSPLSKPNQDYVQPMVEDIKGRERPVDGEAEDNKPPITKQSSFLKFLIENKAMLKPKEEEEEKQEEEEAYRPVLTRTVHNLTQFVPAKEEIKAPQTAPLYNQQTVPLCNQLSAHPIPTVSPRLVTTLGNGSASIFPVGQHDHRLDTGERRKLSNLDLLAEIALRQSPEVKLEPLEREEELEEKHSPPPTSLSTLAQVVGSRQRSNSLNSARLYPAAAATGQEEQRHPLTHLPPGTIIINPRSPGTVAERSQGGGESAAALVVQQGSKILLPIKTSSLLVTGNSDGASATSNNISLAALTVKRPPIGKPVTAATHTSTSLLLNPIMSANPSLATITRVAPLRRHSEGSSSSTLSPNGSTSPNLSQQAATSPVATPVNGGGGTSASSGVGGTTVRCELCGRICSTLAHLNNHIRSVHNNEKSSVPKTLGCRLCPKMFGRSSHLAEHVKTVHEGRKRVYERKACAKCGKEFARQCSLNQHISACHSINNLHNMKLQ